MFSHSPWSGIAIPREHIWDRSCAGAELSQLLGTVSLRKGKALSSRASCSPQLCLQQLLLLSQGKERGSCPLPAHTGLLSCSSPSVAPDISWFTVCHLSLVQQTLPFLRSKGFKTRFLELPFPKLGGTYHQEGSGEARLPALPGSLPWLWGPSPGACPR